MHRALRESIASFIVAVLLVPGHSMAASFDCNRATSKVEKLICAEQGLSQLDENLSQTYRKVLHSTSNPENVKQEQTKWLREVRDKCIDAVCLEKEYGARLAELKERLSVKKTDKKSVVAGADQLDQELICAVKKKDVALVKKLLKKGADANGISVDYDVHLTPILWLAVNDGNADIVRLLLEHDADANTDNWGETALDVAAREGRSDIVALLIKHGAGMTLQVAAEIGDKEAVEGLIESGVNVNEEQTGGLRQTALIKAAEKGQTEVAKLLLEKGADLSARDAMDETALIKAAAKGRTKIAKLLLEKGADPNGAKKDGDAPLHHASRGGHIDTARILLEMGADVNAKGLRGRTPLLSAAEAGKADVIKLLLKNGAEINAAERYGWSPLMRATESGQVDAVRLLLENGAEVDAKTNDGRTALMMAAAKGYTEIAKLCLDKGANVNAEDKDGTTPLLCAAENGHAEMVKLLLEKGSHLKVKDHNGRTATAYATRNGNTDTLETLRAHGVEMTLHIATRIRDKGAVRRLIDSGADVNAKDLSGYSPLMYAVGTHRDANKLAKPRVKRGGDTNQDGAPAIPIRQLEIIESLLNKGADVNAKEATGWTPLMSAATLGNADLMTLLLKKGADVNSKTKDDATALGEAISHGHAGVANLLLENGARANAKKNDAFLTEAVKKGYTRMAKLLLQNGANPNAKIDDGRTPLLLAAGWGEPELVKLLLNKGADPEATDKRGFTALWYARIGCSKEIAELLKSHGAKE